MKFYQEFCLLYIVTCVFSKLILSNTLEPISHLDIIEDQINLTIWMQIRWPFFLQMDGSKLDAVRIQDQNNQDQLLITVHSHDRQTIIIEYELKNQIRDNQSIYINENDHFYEWIQINSTRNICFDRLYNNKINMSIGCDKQFNATLFTVRQKELSILIYDKMEFLNQEIIISDFTLIANVFTFNIFKSDLKILFYAKFYSNLEQEEVFYTQRVVNKSSLNFILQRDYVHIKFMINNTNYSDLILEQKIQYDQWIFCFLSFNAYEVTIYLQINYEIIELTIQIDKYLKNGFQIEQQTEYLFQNIIVLYNGQTLKWGNLILINNIEQKTNLINQELFCVRDCQSCGEFMCQDNSTLKNPSFTISKDIQLSNYYLNIFPNYQEYICTDRKFKLNNDNICIEWPKYYGQYCINCEFLQNKLSQNYQVLDYILDFNNYYYLDKFYHMPIDTKQIHVGLKLEQDLNIFILKIKDIYLIYKTADKFYCEDGYFYKGLKCVKQFKKCQLQHKNCNLCSQNYSLPDNQQKKCVRCQKNCLNCRVINKMVYCVLYINDFYQDDHGLLKECKQNQKELECQGREQIIQNLTLTGHNLCQLAGQYYFYFSFNQTCIRIDFSIVQEQSLQNQKNFLNIYEQKLEIQDMILFQNKKNLEIDEQINYLIQYQQINRIQLLADKFQKNYINQQRQQNFIYLSNTKQTKDNINANKFIFYGVKFFIGQKGTSIIYQQQNFQNLIDLYKRAQIKFKIIQFDILLISYEPLNSEICPISVDEKFVNISFIFNITFIINPSILASKCFMFLIKANEIIIHNLHLQDFNSKCQQKLFYIIADNIFINNIVVKNSNLIQLFTFQNLINLKLNNFFIINSELMYFIFAINQNSSKNSILQIKNIYTFNSLIKWFIYIQDIFYIEISQIQFKDTILQIRNIEINQNFDHQININKVIYNNVTFEKILSIKIKCFIQQGDIIINNITIQNSTLIKSSFLKLENIGQIQILQIQSDKVLFNESELVVVGVFTKLSVKSIYMKSITLINQSYLMPILEGNIFQLKDLYFMSVNLHFSGLIISILNNQTNIINFNIENIQSMQQSFIIVCFGDNCYLDKIKINNIYIQIDQKSYNQFEMNPQNSCIIKNVVLKNSISENSKLFNMGSKYIIMKNLFIINLKVINDIQDYNLIQLQNSYQSTINSIILNNVNILSQSFDFCIINLRNSSKSRIEQLSFNQINAEQPSKQIVFIKSQIQELQIGNSDFQNIKFIQLINSLSTNKLLFDSFIIRNITVLQPFIFHEQSQKKSQENLILLIHLNVYDFTGQLIEIIANEFIITQCINIIIFNYNNSGSLFKFKSNNNLVLKIINIKIFNQKKMVQRENLNGIIFVFQAPISIFIYQLHINQSNQQILYINQTKVITIFHLKICNIYTQNQLFQITQESRYNEIFQLSNIILINVTTINGVFNLKKPSNLSQMKLKNILLQNVSSQKSIFDSDISIDLYRIFLFGGQSKQIFKAYQSIIQFRQSLIAKVNQLSILSESMMIKIQDSEIVDSQIIYDDTKLILEQSIILGNIQIKVNNLKMFLSLNNGQTEFDLNYIDENIYQFFFSDDVKDKPFLYLPSGQNIQNYQFLNYKTQNYHRIYDSISFVSKYQLQQIQCNLSQYYETQLINQYELIMLPGLNTINNLVVILSPLHKDKYINLDLTCNQNNHIIIYRTLIKTFNCQLGEYLYQDQCLQCNIDQQLYSVGYNQAHCQYKDALKIEKLKIGQVKLHKFFWRFSLSNNYIDLCETDTCLGGWKTGDQSCKIGYYGAICSECDINNIRGFGNYGKIDNQCKLCHFDKTVYLKALCVIIYQLVIIYTNYYTNKQQSEQYLFIRIAKRKFTEILLRQNVNQATIILKLFYNYLFTLFLLKESIYFGYYITFSLNLIYNPNYIAVSQLDCLIHQLISFPIQYSQLMYKILMPVLIFNLFIIIYIILIMIRRSKHSIYIVIVCLLTIFYQNQYIIIQSLIKLAQKIKYSNIYWTLEYKASQYYSNIHQYYLFTLIIPLIILFVIINIFIFYKIKIINSRIFSNLKLSSYVYKQYKTDITIGNTQEYHIFIY